MSEDRRILTAADILGMSDRETIEVEVPEWKKEDAPGIVRLQTLSAGEVVQFNKEIADPAKKHDALVRMVVLSVVDEDGRRLFTERDLVKLKDRSFKVFSRLQDEVLKLNGMEEAARKAREAAAGKD